VKDLIVILMTFGFFGLCVAYVALCDRIVGPDPDPDPESVAVPGSDATPVEAGAASVAAATRAGSAR